jgi:hypothetical protein
MGMESDSLLMEDHFRTKENGSCPEGKREQ